MSLSYVFILPCSAACKGKLADHSGVVEDCNEVNSFTSLACILLGNEILQPSGLWQQITFSCWYLEPCENLQQEATAIIHTYFMKLTIGTTLNMVQRWTNGTPCSKVGGTLHVPFNTHALCLDQGSKAVGLSKHFHAFLVLFHNFVTYIDFIALNPEKHQTNCPCGCLWNICVCIGSEHGCKQCESSLQERAG